MKQFLIENDWTEEVEVKFEAETKEEAIKIFHSFINKMENHFKDFSLLDKNRSRVAFSTIRK